MHHSIAENHLDATKLRYFSISHDDPNVTSEGKLRYDACILAPKNALSTNLGARQTLKGGKHAIFIHNGSYRNLDETFNRIFLKRLPDSKEKSLLDKKISTHRAPGIFVLAPHPSSR